MLLEHSIALSQSVWRFQLHPRESIVGQCPFPWDKDEQDRLSCQEHQESNPIPRLRWLLYHSQAFPLQQLWVLHQPPQSLEIWKWKTCHPAHRMRWRQLATSHWLHHKAGTLFLFPCQWAVSLHHICHPNQGLSFVLDCLKCRCLQYLT